VAAPVTPSSSRCLGGVPVGAADLLRHPVPRADARPQAADGGAAGYGSAPRGRRGCSRKSTGFTLLRAPGRSRNNRVGSACPWGRCPTRTRSRRARRPGVGRSMLIDPLGVLRSDLGPSAGVCRDERGHVARGYGPRHAAVASQTAREDVFRFRPPGSVGVTVAANGSAQGASRCRDHKLYERATWETGAKDWAVAHQFDRVHVGRCCGMVAAQWIDSAMSSAVNGCMARVGRYPPLALVTAEPDQGELKCRPSPARRT